MISKIIKEDLVLKVKSKINQYNKFVITDRMLPDGDALGSSLGLYHFLTAEGKEATVVLNDSVADNLKWMPGMEHIVFYDSCPQQAIEKIEEAEVIFCVDFNQAKRMGTISEFILKSNAYKILVDHHLFPDDFCNIIISHPEISSASELVYRLVYQMDEANMISLDMATVIYTGMMTDTGAFTYNSNSPEIYQIISELQIGRASCRERVYVLV